jgi:DNA-3-methyladenine glycosylase I
MASMDKIRCAWLNGNALYEKYHDEEWGVELHDDQQLFEFIVLEGMQAGLSWFTILQKRENYRRLFDQFDAFKIAQYSDEYLLELLNNPGIVRNRLKVFAIRKNALAFLKIQEDFGSFDNYIWSFVNHQRIENKHHDLRQIPAQTKESEVMSKDLKKRGFTFVGPTILLCFYASNRYGKRPYHHLLPTFNKKGLESILSLFYLGLTTKVYQPMTNNYLRRVTLPFLSTCFPSKY